LYFAAQGARRLAWPLAAGILRLAIVMLGGWLVLNQTGSIQWFFAVCAFAMFCYGSIIFFTTARSAWAN
jgi:hypothetical protein